MIACAQCSAKNDLGRVFCTSCGAKLELKALTSETIPVTVSLGGTGKVFALLMVAILLLAILIVGLCMVPDRTPLGKEGTQDAGKYIVGPLRALQGLGSGQTLGRSFREADINGYFEAVVIKRIHLVAFYVDVKPDTIMVRMTKKAGPFKLGSLKARPAITYQVAYKVEGDRLVAESARVGLVPMVGTLKRFAVKPIEHAVTSQHEWHAFRNVTQIRSDENAIWVEVTR